MDKETYLLVNETRSVRDKLMNQTSVYLDKCAQEPGFCLNGATCERVWGSARCHCADGYYGETCGEHACQHKCSSDLMQEV